MRELIADVTSVDVDNNTAFMNCQKRHEKIILVIRSSLKTYFPKIVFPQYVTVSAEKGIMSSVAN